MVLTNENKGIPMGIGLEPRLAVFARETGNCPNNNKEANLATQDATLGERTTSNARRSVVHRDETKPSFMTTEFYAMIAAIVGILVAVAQADNFDAPRAWTLIAAVAIGYMVSRGLAKSGSAHRDHDTDNRR